MSEKDAIEVVKRSRKLVRDGNGVVDNAKVEAETLIAKSKALVAEHARSQAAQGLLEILPQGHGSGLDADMVDGLHAAEIISKAAIRGSGGGGGGSSDGNATKIQDKDVDITARVDDTILVFKSTSDSYIHETKGAPGAHASTHENGGGDEISVAGLSGELADPQTPKAHNQALATITGHDKAAHDALGIDAATLEGSNKAAVQDHAPKAHTHVEADITDLDHDAQKIKGKTVDDAAIADDKILVYKTTGNKLVYEVKPTGGGDMYKSTYDIDEDGKVDAAEDSDKLEGSTKTQVQDHTPKAHTLDSHSEKKLDQLDEKTVNVGVTVDGCLIKDGKVADSNLLEASTKAQVQDHAPKAHTHPVAELTDHNKAAHDALDIDADTVDGAHLADLATDAELATHAALPNVHHAEAHTLASHSSKAHSELTNVGENDHHTKFTTTEHDVTERHTLGTVVPHDALASLSEKSHTSLTDKGTNTHAQIDTHLAASAPHSGHEATANKDQASGYAGLSAGSKLAAGQMPTGKVKTTLSFAVTGTLTTGTDKAPTLLAPCTLTITKVKLVVKTVPTGAAIIVDVNKNGTTIFTTQANRPQIAIGESTGDSGTPDVTALAEGDKLTVDIDQIGSTIAGADLTVEVVAEQAVVFS